MSSNHSPNKSQHTNSCFYFSVLIPIDLFSLLLSAPFSLSFCFGFYILFDLVKCSCSFSCLLNKWRQQLHYQHFAQIFYASMTIRKDVGQIMKQKRACYKQIEKPSGKKRQHSN